MSDLYGPTDALERMEAAELGQIASVASDIERQRREYRRDYAQNYARGLSRVMGKHEEARLALAHILGSLEAGVSLGALEKALATIKGHLE